LHFLTKISVIQKGENSFFFFIYTCDFKAEKYNNAADVVLRENPSLLVSEIHAYLYQDHLKKNTM